MKNKIFLTILPFVLIISCTISDLSENNIVSQLFDELKKEIWNESGDPNNLGLDEGYNYNYSELPTSGKTDHETWAGWYWATYKDAINYKWAGEGSDSPTSKYAKAFGMDPNALEDAVSRKSGIDSQSGNRVCTTNSDCNNLKNGSLCAKRSGEDKGYCIPTWFGQCHAWAPASIMEEEPKNPVKVNGVTFEPQDIKALITYVYNNVRTDFMGARCNTEEKDIKFDINGRPSNIECRDLNPGAMHVILTNWLGIYKKAFVEDRTYDDEVWNQPVRSFEVIYDEKVTKEKAAQLIGSNNSKRYFDPETVTFRHVRTNVNYITESRASENGNLNEDRYTLTDQLEYILELDRSGNIIGGEWLKQKVHPDFFWVPTARADNYRVGNYTFEYSKIKEILQKSIGESNQIIKIIESGSIAKNEWKYYGPYQAKNGLRANLSGNGNIDLYVKRGSRPTSNSYDCLSSEIGSKEKCSMQGSADFYVGLKGIKAGNYKLKLLIKGGENITQVAENLIPNGDFENWIDGETPKDWDVSRRNSPFFGGVQHDGSMKIRLKNTDSNHIKLFTNPITLSSGLYQCSAEVSGNGYIRFGYEAYDSISDRFRTFGEFGSNGEILDFKINLRQDMQKFYLILSVKETRGSHLLVDNVRCSKQ